MGPLPTPRTPEMTAEPFPLSVKDSPFGSSQTLLESAGGYPLALTVRLTVAPRLSQRQYDSRRQIQIRCQSLRGPPASRRSGLGAV
jgi:hypothetical protein